MKDILWLLEQTGASTKIRSVWLNTNQWFNKTYATHRMMFTFISRLQTLQDLKRQTGTAIRLAGRADKKACRCFEDAVFHLDEGRVLPNRQLLLWTAPTGRASIEKAELHYLCNWWYSLFTTQV